MKELFSYTAASPAPGTSPVLILALAPKYLSFIVTDPRGSEVNTLGYCIIDEINSDTLKDFDKKYPSLDQRYKEVRVIYDFPTARLLPYYQAIDPSTCTVLNEVYGDPGSKAMLADNLETWHLKNSYTVPPVILEWLGNKYPSVKSLHPYSVTILSLHSLSPEGKLMVDFRNNEFAVVAAKQSNFLFAGTFEYETPMDVLYQLLRICEQFALSPLTVEVLLSGLIEKDSALYKELYQYFIHIDLRNAEWNNVHEYPSHFFTSFNDMLKCAL